MVIEIDRSVEREKYWYIVSEAIQRRKATTIKSQRAEKRKYHEVKNNRRWVVRARGERKKKENALER